MNFESEVEQSSSTEQDVFPQALAGAERIKALALPIRLSLLEHLAIYGPATATECGSAMNLVPAAASYHLRTLARHGFITEDESETDGRKRRWRAVAPDFRLEVTGKTDDSEATAVGELEATMFGHAAQMWTNYVAQKHKFPPEWQRLATSLQETLILTPSDLAKFESELADLLAKYRGLHAIASNDAARVFVALNAVPREPPKNWSASPTRSTRKGGK